MIRAHLMEFFFYRLLFRKSILLSVIFRERLDFEIWCLRQCCCILKDVPFKPSFYLFSFRLCILGRWCFDEIFLSPEGKMEKKSTIPIDSGGRETYFGPVNIFVKKYLKIVENILEDFFGIYENFFITDSRNTDLNQRSSVGNFFLSTSVPEMTCLESCISRTVGPRDSVSETTLLHFGIRIECR